MAALVSGAKLFRWDTEKNVDRSAKLWVTIALLSWVAVGAAADFSGRLRPVASGPEAYDSITQEQIDAISFAELPADDDVVTPLAPENQELADFSTRLDAWPPGKVESIGQRVRNLVSAASVADILQDPQEGRIARTVFDRLRAELDQDQLEQALAWIVLRPADGTVVTSAPELGLSGNVGEDQIRDRDLMYARKFLGKVMGKIPGGE